MALCGMRAPNLPSVLALLNAKTLEFGISNRTNRVLNPFEAIIEQREFRDTEHLQQENWPWLTHWTLVIYFSTY
jgi:hypothetical protein